MESMNPWESRLSGRNYFLLVKAVSNCREWVPSLKAFKPILHQAQQILKYDGLVLEGWGQVLERKVAVWCNG